MSDTPELLGGCTGVSFLCQLTNGIQVGVRLIGSLSSARFSLELNGFLN